MKSKFVVGILAAVALIASALVALKRSNSSPDQPLVSASTEQAAPDQQKSPPFISSPETSAVHESVSTAAAIAEPTNVESVDARIEHLDKLSANDDEASLHVILSELTNSDARIRKAALEATIQFDSTNAIPTLKQVAETAQDPVEKQELLDAAKFLSLPSIAQSGIKITPRRKAPFSNQTAN